jgi:transposase
LNVDKINWLNFSKNPSIFELDYEALKKRCSLYKEELFQRALHPSRMIKYLDLGYEIDELENCI